MMSLSKEWATLSKVMYGQDFINELSEFLKTRGVKTILECGCGDGNVLQGLAKKGFSGLGIDGDKEMISLALKNHDHPNISYKQMNWLDLANLSEQYDSVLCRGNSLSSVLGWDIRDINPKQARLKIEESVNLFFQKLKQGGLLYVDAVSSNEKMGGITIEKEGIYLKGEIEYDRYKKIRKVYGRGKVLGEEFNGGSTSYLLIADELEEIIKKFKPPIVWHPNLKNEINYEIVCAIK